MCTRRSLNSYNSKLGSSHVFLKPYSYVRSPCILGARPPPLFFILFFTPSRLAPMWDAWNGGETRNPHGGLDFMEVMCMRPCSVTVVPRVHPGEPQCSHPGLLLCPTPPRDCTPDLPWLHIYPDSPCYVCIHVRILITTFFQSEKVCRSVKCERTGYTKHPSCPNRQKRPRVSELQTERAGK